MPTRPPTVTLLFCHGAGFCREIWSPIVARLERSPLLKHHCATGGHIEIATFDLPYHGANRDVSIAPTLHVENTTSPRVSHPATEWPAWSTDAVLRQVEWLRQNNKGDCIIGIGHSIGAAAMWSVEANHPGSFAGLVLFEPICLLGVFPGGGGLMDAFVSACLKRRSQWDSLEEAQAELRSMQRFARWHRESLEAYVHGVVIKANPTNNAIDPDAKFALACHPQIEAAIYCGELLRLSPEEVQRVRCRIIFQYGERTVLFLPHARQPLVDKYPHLYAIAKPVPKTSHTLVLQDPDTVALRIVESLAQFAPFHQAAATLDTSRL